MSGEYFRERDSRTFKEPPKSQPKLRMSENPPPYLTSSPNKFHCELQLPGAGHGWGAQHAGSTGQISSGIEECLIGCVGRTKVSVIQDVEELYAKLHVETLRDSGNVVVLEHREVQILQSWANNAIAPGIAA